MRSMNMRGMRKWWCRAILCSLLLLNCGILTAQGPLTSPVADSIDRLLNSWNNDKGPAISLAVVKNGNVIYSRDLGMANIKSGIANDSTTTFWIASVSKQFTAAAIYQLARQKKLGLNKSIRTYLPDLPKLYEPVTVDHLIHHTSGIRDGFVLTALSKKPPSLYTNENVLHYIKTSAEFNFKPGTRFEYNNSGYVLLAMVIEQVSGRSYPEYLKQNIFQPLGMEHSYVSSTFPTAPQQARGYKGSGEFQEYHFEGNTYGSTGVISTVRDMAKWSAFLQRPGSKPALAPIVPLLLATGRLNNGKPIAYSGGLEKFSYRTRIMYEHFGADEGFKADMIYFPAAKVSVIGLTNHDGFYGLLRLLCDVSDLVHDGKTFPPPSLNETNEIVRETLFYDPVQPQLTRLQSLKGYSKISNSPSGYAAPYMLRKDTLESIDPLPVKYKTGANFIQLVNPYYQKNAKLPLIVPVTKNDDLPGLVGEYFSKELDAGYKIISGERGLKFEFVPGLAFDLYRLTATDFVFDYLGPNFLQFNSEGLRFSREGCRRLKLVKK